ncbi:MAG: rRNA maturation RNase YbeY [Pseudomonadota bacterium]
MITEISFEDQRWADAGFKTLAEAAAKAVIAHLLEPGAWQISVLACDDARISELNEGFREKPGPTNVLAWPSEERGAKDAGGPPVPPQDQELGDIAISYDTCLAEAQAADMPLAQHATHLMVHGTLHLLGYDHIRDEDATLMEGIEIEILGKLGIPNPY